MKQYAWVKERTYANLRKNELQRAQKKRQWALGSSRRCRDCRHKGIRVSESFCVSPERFLVLTQAS